MLFKRHHLLRQTIFECAAALNSMSDGSMGHGLAAAMEAVLTGISGMLSLNFCSLFSCCHVYGAFVAAVATVVSVLAFGPAFNWLSVFFFFRCSN